MNFSTFIKVVKNLLTEWGDSDNISLAPDRNLNGALVRKKHRVLEQLKSGKET